MNSGQTRRNFLKLTGISVASFAFAGSDINNKKVLKTGENYKPADRNIVVILCDQLRKDFLNLYGCNAVPTPNLDYLASIGTTFDNAITQSPVCAPARASMMTGRYVSDHMVWTNDVPFRPGLTYLAEVMNKLGYETGAFGKLHHYPADDLKGFKYAKQMEETRLGKKDDYYQYLKRRHPEIKDILSNYDKQQLHFNYSKEDYYEYFIASEAIKFIKRSTENKKPFLAWVSFQGPHTPYDPPKEVKGCVNEAMIPEPIEFKSEGLPQVHRYRSEIAPPPGSYTWNMKVRKAYCEMIHFIDIQVGRIIQELKKTGQFENTTLIFAADHGDLIGDHNQNYKGPFPYQAQMAIPLVVANHPGVRKQARSPNLVGNIDIPSTVIDIAGSDLRMGVSISLIEQAKEKPKFTRKINFSEFCDSCKIVEDHKYRYAYYPFTEDAQLFDKIKDPEEQNNLAGRKEYAPIENKFLKDIMDFQIIAKGVRIEAHDFVPEQQKGLKAKKRHFEKDLPIAHPLRKIDYSRVKKAGLDHTYNEFCRDKDIVAHYGCYWQDDKNKN